MYSGQWISCRQQIHDSAQLLLATWTWQFWLRTQSWKRGISDLIGEFSDLCLTIKWPMAERATRILCQFLNVLLVDVSDATNVALLAGDHQMHRCEGQKGISTRGRIYETYSRFCFSLLLTCSMLSSKSWLPQIWEICFCFSGRGKNKGLKNKKIPREIQVDETADLAVTSLWHQDPPWKK